jgi:hypothetical protein
MNFDQYFKERSDIVGRVLLEISSESPSPRDWRRYLAGVACIGGAVVMHAWASHTLVDPGFFKLSSIFFTFVLAAGVWLLSIAQGADLLITRATVTSRALLAEKTLSQLLKVDGSIAHKLLARP